MGWSEDVYFSKYATIYRALDLSVTVSGAGKSFMSDFTYLDFIAIDLYALKKGSSFEKLVAECKNRGDYLHMASKALKALPSKNPRR